MPGDQDTTPTRQLMADAITEALENLWLDGKITREERDKVYFDVGYFGDFPDLLPRGKLTMREEIEWKQKGETRQAKIRLIVDRTEPKPYINGEVQCPLSIPSSVSSPEQSCLKISEDT